MTRSPPSAPPRLLPPHYFVLALLLMLGLWLLEPGLLGEVSPLPAPWPWLSALFWAAGLMLAILGSRRFAQAGTNIVPFTESSALVTEGVFRWSRNPMYLGMVLALAGTCVLLNGWFAWMVLIAFVAIIRGYFIPNEELLMVATFGDDYRAYQARVRRWI